MSENTGAGMVNGIVDAVAQKEKNFGVAIGKGSDGKSIWYNGWGKCPWEKGETASFGWTSYTDENGGVWKRILKDSMKVAEKPKVTSEDFEPAKAKRKVLQYTVVGKGQAEFDKTCNDFRKEHECLPSSHFDVVNCVQEGMAVYYFVAVLYYFEPEAPEVKA